MSISRQKGTSAETAVKDYLNEEGIHAKRNPLAGARDVGDIDLWPLPVVIEVKNCKEMKLSEWVGEVETERDNAGAHLGVVWHKRARRGNPRDWYVTMTGTEFIKILNLIKRAHEDPNLINL